jgi:hypothetical protein
VSAINQYCEVMPSAGGGHKTQSGGPSLGGTLPASVVRQLRGAGKPSSGKASHTTRRQSVSAKTRASLLSLPAPAPRLALASARPAGSSNESLFSGLIIALAAVAFGLGAVALARARLVGRT